MERKAGDHFRALQLSTEALERYERHFGSSSPGTISAALNHAVNLRQTGSLSESIVLARKRADDHLAMFGRRHPNTPTANVNLAVALRLNGQADEILGEEHPTTLACALNHALDLRAVGEETEAETRFAAAVDGLRKVHGANHPATVSARQAVRADCDIYPIPG